MTPPRTMLITGTRKGIGKYLSEYYVKRGFRVVGCSRAAPDWSLDGYEHYGVDVADNALLRPNRHQEQRSFPGSR